MWDFKWIEKRIEEILINTSFDDKIHKEINDLLYRLASLVRINIIEPIPPPQIERDLEATVCIEWISLRYKRTLSFSVLEPGSQEGRVWLHCFYDTGCIDKFDPSDADIITAIRKFAKDVRLKKETNNDYL